MNKSGISIDEEINYSLYCVKGNYGVIVSTHQGLFESTLPTSGSPDEILSDLHKRYSKACGGNDLTRNVAERLILYFSGELVIFEDSIDQRRFTSFQSHVFQAVRAIGYGEVKTYGQIAREINQPKAARGVGSAMARNPLPIIIPCHRVIGSSGAMTGYSAPGGVRKKESLIKMEAAVLQERVAALQ